MGGLSSSGFFYFLFQCSTIFFVEVILPLSLIYTWVSLSVFPFLFFFWNYCEWNRSNFFSQCFPYWYIEKLLISIYWFCILPLSWLFIRSRSLLADPWSPSKFRIISTTKKDNLTSSCLCSFYFFPCLTVLKPQILYWRNGESKTSLSCSWL